MAGINALPESTASQLCSTQSLTDPGSLVKELVENALDAKATVVVVEVSSNCLDRIRVRDNGSGIDPADRHMLCKRHHTSKIQSLQDLEVLGGQSLGFRGEALASATEMASTLIVCTRVKGENSATEMRFDSRGHKTR